MSYQLVKWLVNISYLGIREDSEDEISRRVIFSNIVFISLPVVYLVFMALDYEAYMQPLINLRFDEFVVPIVILLCMLGLWLNKLSYTRTGRVLFLACWPFLLHIIPIILLQTPADYYLALPTGIIFHSVLIHLMLSYRKEPMLFGCLIGANFIAIVLSPVILTYFDKAEEIPLQLIANKYYFYDGILYWLLFNLLIFYILHIVENYIKKLNHSRGLIEEQKEELTQLNENLEKIVSERTAELKIQNKKLTDHAHYNAHMLRGPFCRVQGLIGLQNKKSLTDQDRVEITEMLDISLMELDARIKEIQQIVKPEGEQPV